MSKRLTAIFEIGLTQVKSHTETHSEIRITKMLFIVKICEWLLKCEIRVCTQ